MTYPLILVSFGAVLGAYCSALICDLRLERRLNKMNLNHQPFTRCSLVKAGDKNYIVKVLEIEYFGPAQSDGKDSTTPEG